MFGNLSCGYKKFDQVAGAKFVTSGTERYGYKGGKKDAAATPSLRGTDDGKHHDKGSSTFGYCSGLRMLDLAGAHQRVAVGVFASGLLATPATLILNTSHLSFSHPLLSGHVRSMTSPSRIPARRMPKSSSQLP